MNVHMNALQTTEELREGEIDLMTLKKYISFVRGWVKYMYTVINKTDPYDKFTFDCGVISMRALWRNWLSLIITVGSNPQVYSKWQVRENLSF
jgi:hypothetical protein